MVDIGLRRTVPGANDNLTGVAVLLHLARALRERPPARARVILLSTGAEESFMEGMRGFLRRHRDELPPDRTHVLVLDTVGSPRLVLIEGEGMLRMNAYPEDVKRLVAECAEREGVELVRGLKLRFATDGLIALMGGYPTAGLGSVDRYKLPANYHSPTDVPDNVVWETVHDAARLSEAFVRRVAQEGSAAGS
jgi:Zn-dependent M28 family amino/carboxypeptidase